MVRQVLILILEEASSHRPVMSGGDVTEGHDEGGDAEGVSKWVLAPSRRAIPCAEKVPGKGTARAPKSASPGKGKASCMSKAVALDQLGSICTTEQRLGATFQRRGGSSAAPRDHFCCDG